LRAAWISLKNKPYDFFVQSTTWKLGAVSIAILRKQFDKTYVTVAFDNNGRAITLNFIVVNSPDGWVIADVESPHDSLRMFLSHYRN
jgi:ribulose bisphosphate carboxylase small subunit